MVNKNILLIAFVILLSVTNVLAGAYASGTSSETGVDFDNPILIEDEMDLIKLSQTSSDWDKFFRQTADIVFDDSTSQDWDGDGVVEGEGTSGFNPIGNDTASFSGSYDGGGYEIDKLYINTSDTYAGLFGKVYKSIDTVVIKNLGIGSNSVIYQKGSTSESYAGGVIARGVGFIKIDNSYNSGSVSSVYSKINDNYYSYSGGLVGYYYSSSLSISNSYNSGSVSSSSTNDYSGIHRSYSGGLIGYCRASSLVVKNSYNSGDVFSTSSSTLDNSNISSYSSYSGGLVGSAECLSLIIIESHNSGSVSSIAVNSSLSESDMARSFSSSGGLVGESLSISYIDNSYNIGIVSSSSNSRSYSFSSSGGLIGISFSSLEVNNCYNDAEILSSSSKNTSSSGGLIGYNNADTFTDLNISNSYNIGDVSSNITNLYYSDTSYNVTSYCYSGGLVGCDNVSRPESSFSINNSYNIGKISSSAFESKDISGGLIGYIEAEDYLASLSINNSYNNGLVLASNYSGGLIGVLNSDDDLASLNINNSYNSGYVFSNGVSGGLLGSSDDYALLSINNSYNSGGISSSNYSGGFIGSANSHISSSCILNNSYNSGYVFSDKASAGFIGYINSYYPTLNINNSYFDYVSSELSSEKSIASDSSFNGNGATFEDFKLKDFYANQEWFNDITSNSEPWIYDKNGRPYLYWQKAMLSNNVIVDRSIEVSTINQRDFSITKHGLRYFARSSDTFINKDMLNGKVIIDNLIIDSIYLVQPYLLLSNGNYYYGDMISYTATAESEEITVNISEEIVRSSQEIVFETIDEQTYGVPDFTINATGGASGNPITYIGTAGICTISGSTVSIVGAGSCSITANQDGNENYRATKAIKVFNVAKATQEITYSNFLYQLNMIETPTLDFNISSTSNDNVELSSLSENVCTVNGLTVTFIIAGSCEIEATVAENDNYMAATKNIKFEVDDSTPIALKLEFVFTPSIVNVYSLNGELFESKFCNSLDDYREFINSLPQNNSFVVDKK